MGSFRSAARSLKRRMGSSSTSKLTKTLRKMALTRARERKTHARMVRYRARAERAEAQLQELDAPRRKGGNQH
eukprot:596706-Lingulodinium_polyedra.AAC.1